MKLASEHYGSQSTRAEKKHRHVNSLNTNASSLTSATADLTCDESIEESTECVDAGVKENLYINTSAHDDDEMNFQDLTTPKLLKRVDCAIGRISKMSTPCSSRVIKNTAAPSNNINETVPNGASDAFHRIMNKYNQMPISNSASVDAQYLNSACLECQVTNRHFSDLLRQQALDYDTISDGGSLEDALVKKARLESRVGGIDRQLTKYEDVIDNMDTQMMADLARKAAELKSCLETALVQEKESKLRAIRFAESVLTHEIRILRSEFEQALAKGVHIDSSSQRALNLIESNQKAIVFAADSDAKKTVRMKKEIEILFLSTIDHAMARFEKWMNDQLTATSNGKNIKDEAKLLEIKHLLESVMDGITDFCNMGKYGSI
eukprot:scaffold15073_cov72-Cyclotella_meneghiniana.AAC.7